MYAYRTQVGQERDMLRREKGALARAAQASREARAAMQEEVHAARAATAAAEPAPATHSVWTVLEAGEPVDQTGDLPKIF